MIKNNTVKKGNAFEERIYKLFQELLINEELFVSGKKSRIYWKKEYYSEMRKGFITVDISIETYLNGADKYSFLTIIECKNYYSKGIPIDDIEELDSKLNQIGEHNTKGIIITNSYFQEGTRNFAASKKIGLVRVNDKNEVDWVNYRKDRKKNFSDTNTIKSLLCSDKLQEKNFIASFEKKYFETIPDLFIELEIIDRYINKSKFLLIPYKSEKEINEIISKHLPVNTIYKSNRLDIDEVCSLLNSMYKVNFRFDDDINFQSGVLGKITFNPLEIYISNALKSDIYRWRFTFAHEVGHLVLHYKKLVDYLEEYIDDEHSISFNQDYSIYFNERLEIQANIFASRLLLPQESLLNIVSDYFQRERNYKGYLHLDEQPQNISLTYRLLRELQEHFLVSKEVAKYRLISLGIIHDKTNNSISGILRRTT